MSEIQHTPGPWHVVPGDSVLSILSDGGRRVAAVGDAPYWEHFAPQHRADANLIVAAPDLLAALKAASGYLLNAKIDLETGAPKKTAIDTIEGGLRVVREALARAGCQ